MKRIVTAPQVAALYDVTKMTVYRWAAEGLFDPPPQKVPSPSSTRDRLLFDLEDIAAQYKREMLDPVRRSDLTTYKARHDRLVTLVESLNHG